MPCVPLAVAGVSLAVAGVSLAVAYVVRVQSVTMVLWLLTNATIELLLLRQVIALTIDRSRQLFALL